MNKISMLGAALLVIGTSAFANDAHTGHGGEAAAAPAPANKAYMDSMQTMHDDMHEGIMAKDPDVAFAAGMLAHHEGAVEMARIQLEHGKDEEMRALAKAVIAAQEKEITQLRQWLAKHRP
ncbi:CopM family metallochaperone [Pseudomonas matsuisoli]|uniref:DUF305 domain-containing protein n=1 Tax=Pseudomonas matsuisoli TaxID=1515666 RepID=A0A917UW37_9PSED|nr:DUF305 domain-containing protein [Pseudomonas matsuisoli]GGJ89445.1 hypothetical protein GCM10009304_13800 [Pseudomonas matsuisoli]